MDSIKDNPIPIPPPLPIKEVGDNSYKSTDYRTKDLALLGYCRPESLKERVSSARVLKLCKLLYRDYDFIKLGGYKAYRRYPFYVEYQVIDKRTDKVIIPRATANTLLELVRDEYYDYINY